MKSKVFNENKKRKKNVLIEKNCTLHTKWSNERILPDLESEFRAEITENFIFELNLISSYSKVIHSN